MKLSNNFSLNEFTKSQTALRKGISNKPGKATIKSLKNLCKYVLQPIRYSYDLPVTINSGYRSPSLNRAIGGSGRSQHCLGEAADIEIQGIDNKEVAKWIRTMTTFDQLILEFYQPGKVNLGWVHVSYRKGRNRKQVLRAVKRKGKTAYLQGLEGE